MKIQNWESEETYRMAPGSTVTSAAAMVVDLL